MTKKLKRKPTAITRDPEINGIPEKEYTNPKSPNYIPSSQRPNEPKPIMVPGYGTIVFGGPKQVNPGHEYRGEEGGIHYEAKKANVQAKTPKPNPPPPILGDQQPAEKANKIPPTLAKQLIEQKGNPISPAYGMEEPQENLVEKKIVRPLSKEYFEKKYPIQMLMEPPKKKKK